MQGKVHTVVKLIYFFIFSGKGRKIDPMAQWGYGPKNGKTFRNFFWQKSTI
jgi:hypothetical protein